MASGFSVVGGGAELTREEVKALLIEPLMAESRVLSAGPQVFDSDGGVPVQVPKIASWSLPAGAFVAENTLIAESDPTYGEVTLLPASLKSLKVIHRVSSELARHAVVNIGAALSGALVRMVGLEMDKQFLVGVGGAGNITGLANATGAQVTNTVGALTIDKLLDIGLAKLLTANGNPSSAAWFMPPRDFITLRKQKDSQGQYLVTPNPQDATAYQMLGMPIYTTTQIASNGGAGTNESTVVLADMGQVAVGRDLDAKFDLLTETYANYDQIGIRVISRMDIAPLNAAAVCVLKGVTP